MNSTWILNLLFLLPLMSIQLLPIKVSKIHVLHLSVVDFQDGVEAGAVEGAEVRQVATARQDLIHMLMQ